MKNKNPLPLPSGSSQSNKDTHAKNSLPHKVWHTIIEGQDSRGTARSGVLNAAYSYAWKFCQSLIYPPG